MSDIAGFVSHEYRQTILRDRHFFAPIPDTQTQHTDRLTTDGQTQKKTNQQDNTHPRQKYTDSETDIETAQQYTATDSFHAFLHWASCAAFVPSSKRKKSFNQFINHIISSIATPSMTSTYQHNQSLDESTTVMKGEREGQKCKCSDCSAITEY